MIPGLPGMSLKGRSRGCFQASGQASIHCSAIPLIPQSRVCVPRGWAGQYLSPPRLDSTQSPCLLSGP